MSDVKLIVCSVCSEKKPRQLRFTPDKRRYYTNPNTEDRWSGKNCPECLKIWHELDDPNEKLSARKCRDCGTALPLTRYFKCLDCQPELARLDDEWVYDAEGIDSFTEEVAETLSTGLAPVRFETKYEKAVSEETGQDDGDLADSWESD